MLNYNYKSFCSDRFGFRSWGFIFFKSRGIFPFRSDVKKLLCSYFLIPIRSWFLFFPLRKNFISSNNAYSLALVWEVQALWKQNQISRGEGGGGHQRRFLPPAFLKFSPPLRLSLCPSAPLTLTRISFSKVTKDLVSSHFYITNILLFFLPFFHRNIFRHVCDVSGKNKVLFKIL